MATPKDLGGAETAYAIEPNPTPLEVAEQAPDMIWSTIDGLNC
jgi:hypothetical protein